MPLIDEIRQHNGATVALSGADLDLLDKGGLQVLSALMGSPNTSHQLAVSLGLSRARVQYIIDQLVERGLARVHRQVREADRIDVYYVADVQDVILALSDEAPRYAQLAGAQLILSTLQEHTLQALTSPAGYPLVVLKLVQCRMSRHLAQTFVKALERLAIDFNSSEEDDAEEEFALTLALYPVSPKQA